MKLRLPHLLLTSLLSCLSAAASTNPGNIVFVGDSITQGGTWAGAGTQPSYRYSFFKNMVDQELTYTPMGIGEGSSTATSPRVGTLTYKGIVFNNTHEAAASARTYTWSGIPADNSGYRNNPGTRPYEAPVWNLLGLTNPQTGSTTDYYNQGELKTYSGPTYASKYGTELPDTVCIMIGINDLFDGRAEQMITNTKAIVKAYQLYNPNVNVLVMALLPTGPANGTYGMTEGYNTSLKAAVEATGENSWSTDTSQVTFADVSAGFSPTEHADNADVHPNSQGELLIAGSLANALGVGQRTLGLTGKSVSTFTHRLDSTTLEQTNFSISNPNSEWSVLSDETTEAKGLLIQADRNSAASITADTSTGWNVSAAAGFTLQVSVQMSSFGGNDLFMQFGDGAIGDGLLHLTATGVYWGESNTLLYEGGQTSMNDFRITYMATGNEQQVDAGYYVWMNNQLIGEALAAGSEQNDFLTIGSANGFDTYAAISDISWETGNWSSADSSTIQASLPSFSDLPHPTTLEGDAIIYTNESTDLSNADAWGGSVPNNYETIRFDSTCNQASLTLASELSVRGVEFETGSAVTITSTSAPLAVGEGGITVSEFGSNVFIQRLKVTEAQTWTIGANQYLTIGSGPNSPISLTADWTGTDHTVTITGGGSVILNTAAAALQDINWKVTGGSALKAIWNTVGSNYIGGLGSGSVTLDNGTLSVNFGAGGDAAANHGNWNWGNNIIIGSGGGTIAQGANQGANRWLNLSGSISLLEGASTDASLTFTRVNNSLTISDPYGFILSGNNSGFDGKIIVDSGAYLRVGAASATDGVGTNGTLHAGALEIRSGGYLTLTRTDTWEVASNISGAGTLNIGSTNSIFATTSQRVTLTGNNSGFTGTVNINQGTLVLDRDTTDTTALGSPSSVAIKASGRLDLNGHDLDARSITLSFTSGGVITNSAAETSKITFNGSGLNTSVWANATFEAAEGKTVQLQVGSNHAAFNGKLTGTGVIEKLGTTYHLILKATDSTFSGTIKASEGYVIFDPTGTNTRNFTEGYRPDLEIASGAKVTLGNAHSSEATALQLGNVSGEGNFTADYGAATHYVDVQIDREGGVTFSGQFLKGSSQNRDYGVIKRGTETWTLTGTNTATGALKVAEGELLMQGSWAGAAQVEADGTMTVSGSVGDTTAARTHIVQQGGKLSLTGAGELRNSGAVISSRSSMLRSAGVDALLSGVTVAADGITRTGDDGTGTISDATVTINQTTGYTIENIALKNTMLDIQAGASVTLRNVALSGTTSLQTAEEQTTSLQGANTLTLAAENAQATQAITHTPLGGTELTFAGLTTSLLSGVALASDAVITIDVVNQLLCSSSLAGQHYLAVTLEGLTGIDTANLTTANFALDEHLTNGFHSPEATPSIIDVQSLGNGTVVYISFDPALIPEPTSSALGLLGLAGLAFRRRRKAN